MTPDERWLATVWPLASAGLPPAPAHVLEIGCGPLGGFVPMLRSAGYTATGVDPEAPEQPGYVRAEFEHYRPPGPADAIVACTSLHHVADLPRVTDLMAAALRPGGAVVVVEWARERFDEATARWCFDRLPPPDGHAAWMHELREQWRDSGQPWDDFIGSWAESEGLHAGRDVLAELAARFESGPVSYGPYYFAELSGTSADDEQAAIDGGQIQANRILYLGIARGEPAPDRDHG